MDIGIIIQAIIVAGVTALATGFVNSKVMDAKLNDLIARIKRIEDYLNGLLKGHEK